MCMYLLHEHPFICIYIFYSPTTSTMEGNKVQPSNVNVPHQTADSGVENAVITKAVSKQQQQQQQQPPAQEYAMVDKSKKKNSAANQGVSCMH